MSGTNITDEKIKLYDHTDKMRALASSLWYKMCTFLTNMSTHIDE